MVIHGRKTGIRDVKNRDDKEWNGGRVAHPSGRLAKDKSNALLVDGLDAHDNGTAQENLSSQPVTRRPARDSLGVRLLNSGTIGC